MIRTGILALAIAFVLTFTGISFAQTVSPSPTIMRDMGTNNDQNNVPADQSNWNTNMNGQGAGSGTNNTWMPSSAPNTGLGGASQ